MATLYLTEQGSVLKKDHLRFIVEKEDKVIFEIPVFKVNQVLIFGNVQITTQAMTFLLENGIDTTLLSMTGRLKGKLVPIASKNILLRMTQFEKAKDYNFALSLAKTIVRAKIANANKVMQRYSRNHPEVDFSSALQGLEWCLKAVERKETLNSLVGVEGQASAIYFETYGKMFRKELEFSTRSRRPPKDPVNALLSLGYTLLTNEAVGVVTSIGFDPYIGFLHGISYGRPSLALDLVEEFRHSIVDRLTLTLLNKQILEVSNFEQREDGGFYLNSEGRKKYFYQYEARMLRPFRDLRNGEQVCFRRLLLIQAQKLAKTIQGNIPYEPFTIE